MSTAQEVVESELNLVSVNNAIAEIDKFETEIVQLESEFKDRVYDMEDKAQNKQARSDRVKLSSIAKKIDEVRKANKKDLEKAAKEFHEYASGTGKRVEALRDAIKAQVDKWDDEQKQKEEDAKKAKELLDEKIHSLTQLHLISGNETSDELQARITAALEIEIDESYGERIGEAKKLLKEAIESLQMFYDNTLEAEKEKAELEQLRKEKEEREAAEAKKKHEEEIAEKARQEERERIEAEQKEESPVITQESSIGDVTNAVLGEDHPVSQAMNNSIPDQDDMRQQDIQRVKNREALEDLKSIGVSEEVAINIIKYIANNRIRNISINY